MHEGVGDAVRAPKRSYCKLLPQTTSDSAEGGLTAQEVELTVLVELVLGVDRRKAHLVESIVDRTIIFLTHKRMSLLLSIFFSDDGAIY